MQYIVEKVFRSLVFSFAVCIITVFLIVAAAGCARDGEQEAASPPEFTPVANEDDLKKRLDDVLDFTFENRRLNTEQHAAWQILHGALAFQKSFPVDHDGRVVSAVDHILQGGRMEGWTVERGDLFDEKAQRYGLRAILEPGTKTGQGHNDQWLAVLAQCELPADQTVQVNERTFSMADFVLQVQWDAPRNVHNEFSWTVIGLTSYLPTDSKWTASDGREWSIDRLIEIEAGQELESSACGGTHRLIGMTMAVNRRMAEEKPLTGPWRTAETVIQKAVRDAKANQNPDGSFSINYFSRPGQSPDLAQNLGVTGHILEFLALALTDDQLREAWVQRAAMKMCDLFETTKQIDMECGALYHAAHGLVLYRNRVFGERKFQRGLNDEKTAAIP